MDEFGFVRKEVDSPQDGNESKYFSCVSSEINNPCLLIMYNNILRYKGRMAIPGYIERCGALNI